MMTDKCLTFRGEIKAAIGAGAAVLFVTAHPEGQPTALYQLDADKLTLAETPLPAGGVAVVVDESGAAWVAATDRVVYRVAAGGKASPVGAPMESEPAAVILLAEDRVAVLAGTRVAIRSRDSGTPTQAPLSLPEPGTKLAADPTGRWLVAGTNKGTVCVFDCEEKDEYLLSESAKLHEGAVTALLFEPDELRFFSAGADGKLLSTHARGKLEPEDKGRGNNHADAVTSLVWSNAADRFFSGSRDGTVKAWPRAGGAKPSTVKDAGKVVALAVVQVHNRSLLAAAGEDQAVRFFPLDPAGKPGDASARARGAAAWAEHELSQPDPKRRESVLRTLAGHADGASLDLVAAQATSDPDHALRLVAAQLLGESDRPRAAKLLENLLTHNDEAVRVAAFAGLRRHLGETDLRPLDLALSAGKADVGRLAVAALEKLAGKDDQALARLTKAVDAKTPDVRQAALAGLENVYGPNSPEANLLALGSKHADLRRLSLARLLQRGLLREPRAQSAVRRSTEDADGEVRRAAFLLSLHTRPALLAALRARDPELERQVAELGGAGPAGDKPSSASPTDIAGKPKTKGKAPKQGAARPDAPPDLDETDLEPLLRATASRPLDTCLRGARGLALLGDERALGLLLQLSRENDPAARAEVARAMSALADPRSVVRLRSLLFDPDAAVRDAAFTALARLHEADPLVAADAGLGAANEDVRRRGLQAVVAAARAAPPTSADEPAWPLLIRALNDASPAVRTEAFKAALNLQVGGGGPGTLRFVLQSVHADVRREVLTELMAQVGQAVGVPPWAWGLLLEFYNDPDPALRGEAFDFAVKAKAKGNDLEALEPALRSRHGDVRRRAVEALVKRHTKAAQALLATVLADPHKDVRLTALDALVGDDVREALAAALGSPHDDVHARAATALARHGDAAALESLVELVRAPELQGQPKERVAEWAALVETALDGLAELADPAALPHVQAALDSPHAAIRKSAAWALAWVAMGDHPGALRQAMQHADPQVKYHAALGLALGGEASAAPLVFSAEATKVLPAKERLAAAVALGPAGEDRLVAMLDDADERVRAHALMLLMLLELKASGDAPTRCLACLSAREPRVRLRAARGLDSFRSPELFLQFVTRLFDDRAGDGEAGKESKSAKAKPWDIPPRVVDAVAELIARGTPRARARTARLLGRLFKDEQGAWDRGWAVHEARHAGEIDSLRTGPAKGGRPSSPAAARYTGARLEDLAFGAYIGLVREQGEQAARVRQTALGWVLELARRDVRFVPPARAVFVQALSDPIRDVRTQAFEQLRALTTDPTALGAEALETGHTDLGVRALELLSGGGADAAGAPQGQAVLEQAMLTRTDDLAAEAARLLAGRRGVVTVAAAALGAAHEPLRQQAVAWLAAEYEQDPAAGRHLRDAMAHSRYAKVREAAAFELATKKDAAAFEALARLLAEASHAGQQKRVIAALEALGDPRTPGALLDRVENDPAGDAAYGPLVRAAGGFRQPQTAERLLAMMDRNPKWREAAAAALLAVAGFDQPVEDPEDERPDDSWEKKQHPRRPDVLARLMDKLLGLGDAAAVGKLIPDARWSRGNDVDPVLSRLAAHANDALRQEAVRAAAWRVRKRGAPPEPLATAVSHRDPLTQFLAAEGLARAGRGEGTTVLLSAIDLMPDLALRRRAVEALGPLADTRALDVLLRLAGDDGHALQEAAAEALGHLGRSANAGDVLRTLERLAMSGGPAAAGALHGLRWLDTPDAWRAVRRAAADPSYDLREVAVDLLGHDDDPDTRGLLLRLLAGEHEDDDLAFAAWNPARRLWGPDSLAPDFALLRSRSFDHGNALSRAVVRRVAGRGEPGQVFAAVAAAHAPEVKAALSATLLNRTPLPVKEAEAALPGDDPATVALAAKVLGRAGTASNAVTEQMAGLVRRWLRRWEAERENDAAATRLTQTWDNGPPEGGSEATLEALLWAAARLGAGTEAVAEAAVHRVDDAAYRSVRRAAVVALAAGKASDPAALSALETTATGADPDARALAAAALAARDPARASRRSSQLLPDRVAFNRMMLPDDGAVDAGPALRGAAADPHYQGVALPCLIARRDVGALSAAAQDQRLPEATRVGAVEALGAMAAETAEARLRAIGLSKDEGEELRKAAWRALRRSTRARQTAVKMGAKP